MHLRDTELTSSGEHYLGALPNSALCRGGECDSRHEGATRPGICGEVLGIAFPESAPEASCGCPGTQHECDRTGGRKADGNAARVHGYRRNDLLARAIAGTDRCRGCRLQRRASATHGSKPESKT